MHRLMHALHRALDSRKTSARPVLPCVSFVLSTGGPCEEHSVTAVWHFAAQAW